MHMHAYGGTRVFVLLPYVSSLPYYSSWSLQILVNPCVQALLLMVALWILASVNVSHSSSSAAACLMASRVRAFPDPTPTAVCYTTVPGYAFTP